MWFETVIGDWVLFDLKQGRKSWCSKNEHPGFDQSGGVAPDDLGEEEYGVLDEVECERLERERTMCFLVGKVTPVPLWFSSAVCLLSSCSEIGCGFYCVLLLLLLQILFFILPVRSHLYSDAQYLTDNKSDLSLCLF